MKQKKIMRQAPMQKVVGKPAAKPHAGAGISTAPPKFVPQPRKN